MTGEAQGAGWRERMSDEEIIGIIARGIADAQGDAYAEYSSEFDGYARAAISALKANLAGLSHNGVNVWGAPADIKAVMRALYSDSILEDVRTQARHWREYAGKVEAKRAEAIEALKAVIAWSQEPDPESKSVREQQLCEAWRQAREIISKSEARP